MTPLNIGKTLAVEFLGEVLGNTLPQIKKILGKIEGIAIVKKSIILGKS